MLIKSQLIGELSKNFPHLPEKDLSLAVNCVIEQMSGNLSQGGRIEIRGFGSFITKKRAAKIGRNIKKNVAVHIPEHYIPAFKPSKEFVNEVKHMQTAQ